MRLEREKNGWASSEQTNVSEVWSNKVNLATGINSSTEKFADGAVNAASTAVSETATSVHPAVKVSTEILKKVKETTTEFLAKGARNNRGYDDESWNGGILVAIAAVIFFALTISYSILPNILIPGIGSVIFQEAEEEEDENDD